MTTPQSTDHACLHLGKRGAFEGVARRPWMADGMGTDDAQTPATNRPCHSPQRWVEKVDSSIKGSDTPHLRLPGMPRVTRCWPERRASGRVVGREPRFARVPSLTGTDSRAPTRR
jgi:hypothetical protein